MAGLRPQQDEDFVQRVPALLWQQGRGAGKHAKRMGSVGNELGGHLGRRQLVVDQPRGHRAARHPVELAGGGVLGHDHATLPLDRPQALCSVAARAGKDDANRPLVAVQGE